MDSITNQASHLHVINRFFQSSHKMKVYKWNFVNLPTAVSSEDWNSWERQCASMISLNNSHSLDDSPVLYRWMQHKKKNLTHFWVDVSSVNRDLSMLFGVKFNSLDKSHSLNDNVKCMCLSNIKMKEWWKNHYLLE